MLIPSLADLLHRIPLSARSVLDVRCGTGILARAYRPMNPRVRFLGIDQDELVAKKAAQYLDDVATTDVEADPMPFDVPGGIDCIIYESVLEYLNDPWGLVNRHAQFLSPDGVMLISLPNPDFWRSTDRLLRGRYETEATAPVGLFAEDQVRRHLFRAGLNLCDALECQLDQAGANRLGEALSAGLEALDIDVADFTRRSAPQRLLWRVRKEARQSMIVSGNMLPPVGGVSHLRVVHPLQAVGTDPSVRTQVTDQVETWPGPDEEPRIFVLHRPALLGERGHDLLRRLTEAGYLVVTEFDDHPDHFSMMQQGGELSFRGVHALQTSTPALAEVLRQYNEEVAIFPNGIASLPVVRNFRDPNVMTLFFGALNREADWEPYMPVINEIAALAKDRLRFQVIHDQAFFDALATPHKAFTPTCDYDTYLRILGGCEISFMPLGDTAFNRCKSDLKFIESGACRVAPLGSPIVYEHSMEDGKTGYLFRDPGELRNRLLRLLALPGIAKAIGDAARDHVLNERMLAYQVAPRIDWYRSLWARRDILREALRERMAQPFQRVVQRIA